MNGATNLSNVVISTISQMAAQIWNPVSLTYRFLWVRHWYTSWSNLGVRYGTKSLPTPRIIRKSVFTAVSSAFQPSVSCFKWVFLIVPNSLCTEDDEPNKQSKHGVLYHTSSSKTVDVSSRTKFSSIAESTSLHNAEKLGKYTYYE